MEQINTTSLAKEISGKLIGPEKPFTGIFNILGDANPGDIVIRHWIDETGIKIAQDKDVCCIITQDPQGESINMAKELDIPLIIMEKIEIANAFALIWAIEKFAPESKRVVITGTNGKSTTTHMVYHILKEAGWTVYTNTDSKSEFNTLIDPIVSKQISEFSYNLIDHLIDPDQETNKINNKNLKIDALVIEVSEVQGWLDKVMRDHAKLMTAAVDPDVVVITNVAIDHIGLVNSLEDAFKETSGAVKSLRKGFAVFNSDDELVMKMGTLLNPEVMPFCHGHESILESRDDGIFFQGTCFIKKEDLPFRSHHFIQNTLSAISACICLGIPMEYIKTGVSSYKALNRRFSIINRSPLIIDDFAHNPDGIKATIKSAASDSRKLWVVCSIRGSRGDEINLINAQALVEVLKSLGNTEYGIIITSSSDVVDHLNVVESHEKKVFLDVLDDCNQNYIFLENLGDSLKEVIKIADDKDTILLIGAQGMDPAAEILNKIIYD
jgi:UDP-N-acetylmuramoyl-L-alanyl-D-glutamate--2,6-diaminopimelate ligase